MGRQRNGIMNVALDSPTGYILEVRFRISARSLHRAHRLTVLSDAQ